ncbi:lytic transglycosylase domain-containing protein [Viridibacterium curvum]
MKNLLPARTPPLACLLLAGALLIGSPLTRAGNIYTFVDEHGTTHFTDRKDDPRARLYWRDPNGPKGIEQTRQFDVLRRPPDWLMPHIETAANAHRIEPALLAALIAVESRYNPKARSPKGAMGLTQLMPQTAQRFGVRNAYDVQQNLHGGARYLAWLLDTFDNDVQLALAGFNAGEGAVMKHGRRIPPYAETQYYVPAVLAQLRLLRREAKEARNRY